MTTRGFDPEAEPTRYLYERLADYLAQLIEAGEFRHNQPLPSEERFAQQYGVSPGTARHATKLLQERGLVVSLPSKGTYVRSRSAEENRR
jgi:GntR family transcriptional regulator